jgi:hypothetical protein
MISWLSVCTRTPIDHSTSLLMESNSVRWHGWMDKTGAGPLSGWQRRYFVLTLNSLDYFAPPKMLRNQTEVPAQVTAMAKDINWRSLFENFGFSHKVHCCRVPPYFWLIFTQGSIETREIKRISMETSGQVYRLSIETTSRYVHRALL